MKTAVVMTTYNGERYLIEQMDSLRKQTRLPDEVLILDDGSTDATPKLIQEYIQKYNLSSWKCKINEQNIGWKRNFINGFDHVSGDIIFPCDQDDIWCLDKIEKMSAVMEQNPNINVLEGHFHKYFISTDKVKLSISTLRGIINVWTVFSKIADKIEDIRKKSNETQKIIYKKFDNNFLKIAPGCVMCIRKSFFNRILTYWRPDFGHDAFFTFFAKVENSYVEYDSTVITWNQHEDSTSHVPKRGKDIRESELTRNTEVFDSLEQYINDNPCRIYQKKNIIRVLKNARKWNDARMQFMNTKNPVYGLYALIHAGFYERSRSILTDWLYAYLMPTK